MPRAAGRWHLLATRRELEHVPWELCAAEGQGHRPGAKPTRSHSFSPAPPLQCPLLTKLTLQLTGKETDVRAQVCFHRAGKEGELGTEK